jgi:ribonuclease P protein component
VGKQFTLGKNERLKSRKQIEYLFSKGKNFNLPPFRVYYSISKLETTGPLLHRPASQRGELPTQFGAGVSGKNFKKAVDRNRIKRLTREAYRLQNLSLKDKLKEKGFQLTTFFIYTAKEIHDFNFIKKKLAVALKKLEMIVDENIPSHS